MAKQGGAELGRRGGKKGGSFCVYIEGGPPGWAPLCFVARQADGPAPCEADKKQFLRGLLRAWYWSRFYEVLQVEQMFVH